MKRTRAWAAGLLCLLYAAAVRAGDGSPWQTAFPTAAAPPQVHFRADYRDAAGREHELEVWRQSDRRLRRTTDGAIDLYVEKSASGEYEYRLVDRSRKLLIDADRTTLYRIGVFSDWISLAHVLKVPHGEYRVTQADRQSPALPGGSCVWKRLEVMTLAPSTSEICWSARWGLPLEIDSGNEQDGWKPDFRLQAVEPFAPRPEIFAVPREGLLEIDTGGDEWVSD
jgi:hypothetical protein